MFIRIDFAKLPAPITYNGGEMEDFYRKLGWALKTQRKHKRFSQTEMARVLGVSYQQVQKYESGIDRIPIDKLDTYCDYLEVKSQWIIDHSKGVTIEG